MNAIFKITSVVVLSATLGLFWPGSVNASEVCLRVSEEASLRELSSGEGSKQTTQSLKPDTCNPVELAHASEIISDTRIPVILVPVTKKSEITVNSPLKQDVIQKIADERIDSMLSTVMGDLADIQNQMRKQRLDQALHNLLALESKHPNVKFLEFTRASILLLQGNREEARRVAQAAILVVPDYEEGRKFLNSLTHAPESKGHP